MLKVKNLTLQVKGQMVLEKINLQLEEHQVYVLLGPNGAGKSSLAKTIMGYPGYQIVTGQLEFAGQDLTSLSIAQRVKLGLGLAVQNPPAINGVKLKQLLALTAKNNDLSQVKLSQDLLERELNVNFSGGEKKLAEIWQVLSRQPKFVIFDELDAGLDLQNLERVEQLIANFRQKHRAGLLFITHTGALVEKFKPDWTYVMLDKKIICQDQDYQRVIHTIKQYGYEKCQQCPKKRSNKN